MEPVWHDRVLRQEAYYSKTFQDEIAYDKSSREEFYNEIALRSADETYLSKTSKLKDFFVDIIKERNTATAYLKHLDYETVFHPGRNYWQSYNDYLTYSICPFLMGLDTYAAMKYVMIKRTGWLSLGSYLITKIFVNWTITYIMIGLGAYHKHGIFHLRFMLPISKYFPYLTTGMVIWSMSTRIDLSFELFVYFIMYTLAALYIIDIQFSECSKVLSLPPNLHCFDPGNNFNIDRSLCRRVIGEEFTFTCPDNKQYLLAEQIFYYFLVNDAMFKFISNVTTAISLVFMVYLSSKIHSIMKIIRIAIIARIGIYIVLIFLARDFLVSPEVLGSFSFLSIFKRSNFAIEELYYGCFIATRFLPSLFSVQWASTARLAGSTRPQRDSVLVILIDVVVNCMEFILFFIMYSHAVEKTMLRCDQIVGREGKRVPIVVIHIFVLAYSSYHHIAMIIVLLIFSITHFNSLVCEFESLKFCISLMDEKASLNINFISLALIPVFYLLSSIYRVIQNTSNAMSTDPCLDEVITVISFILFFIIFYIYSYNRFQLDIEFMTGRPPAPVIQFLIFCTFMFGVGLLILASLNALQSKSGYDEIIFFLMLIIMTVTSVAYVLITYYLNKKEFKSYLVPSYFYGPPNNELRRERKLYQHKHTY